ncbi:metal-dependent phosphohydrolase [Megamonas hypermegale]|uniref:HD domain-containing protein n=1 Tax=Megamonas hypermegale TaxID=158847 RepID=UPI000B394A84|nr:HD domain-containing protein [Megamonas hypermegale]OUO40450.1 metal-dependent phosphohydrolase [Megamonas hypermegale]
MDDIKKMQELWQEMSSWMTTYMKSFYSPEEAQKAKSHLDIKNTGTIFFDDAQIVDGIVLKEKHTWKVTNNCERLAKHLGLNEHDKLLAKMIGLFHDVGRFRQFTIYRTFNDALSENHAKLGLSVIKDLSFMKKLSEDDLATLNFAIGNHNAKEIAPTNNKRFLSFAKLIRDADKIDIYRVLKPYLGPTDGTGCSPDFVELFVQGMQCDYTKMRTQDDRKLVRLMWVYDINYAWSLQQIINDNYIEEIIGNLPHDEAMMKGINRLREYMQKKLETPDIWEG